MSSARGRPAGRSLDRPPSKSPSESDAGTALGPKEPKASPAAAIVPAAAPKRELDPLDFLSAVQETYNSPHFTMLSAADLDANDSLSDLLMYKVG